MNMYLGGFIGNEKKMEQDICFNIIHMRKIVIGKRDPVIMIPLFAPTVSMNVQPDVISSDHQWLEEECVVTAKGFVESGGFLNLPDFESETDIIAESKLQDDL